MFLTEQKPMIKKIFLLGILFLFTLISVQYANAWQLDECTGTDCCGSYSGGECDSYSDGESNSYSCLTFIPDICKIMPFLWVFIIFILSLIIIFYPFKNKKTSKSIVIRFIFFIVIAIILSLSFRTLYYDKIQKCMKIVQISCSEYSIQDIF